MFGFKRDDLLLPAVFFVSFAAVGWQLGLMRCLLISRYYHFSFLVISCALLGFGAGGTILTLAGPWFLERQHQVLKWGILAFAVSLPACFRLGELLPLNVYFPPVEISSTLAWWFFFWIIHCVPFFVAGALIGLALMSSKESVPKIYAANLAGSAVGALGCILLLGVIPPNELVIPLTLLVLVGGFFLVLGSLRKDAFYAVSLTVAGTIVASGCLLQADRIFPLNIDQYKPLAYVERLAAQGNAKRTALRFGQRGRIDLYSSTFFHSLLALSSREAPPQMDMLMVDGFQAGSVLAIDSPDQALFLEGTLSALPYRLIRPKTILILGETSGVYTWAARRTSAESIVVVQPDGNIIDVLKQHKSRVLDDPRIRVIEEEPRAFLDTTSSHFDVVQLAGLEGFAAGSGGIGGLREDYLATVQGYAKCLEHSSDQGIACVVRGIQDPERDNLKIVATWIEALRKTGVRNPGDHLLLARDELSLATLVGKSQFGKDATKAFRDTARKMSWDVEWFPGVKPDDTNTVHILPGPQGTNVSWYHRALQRLLSSEPEEFYASWMANVQPASDDKPFFYDFFKWQSISKLAAVFGPLWPARAEMGFLLLLMGLAWTIIFATVLLPAPIVLLKRGHDAPTGRFLLVLTLYFAGLGTGFMFLEMSFIQIFTRFFGDPVVAAGVVVGSFLFFAGLGSMSSRFLARKIPGGVLTLGMGIALLVLVDSLVFSRIFEAAAAASGMVKYVLGVSLMVPLSFFMGVPFPWGLSRVHEIAGRAVPLAWAVNGFASVVSASAAVLVAMVFGFSVLLTAAAAVYACAGLLSRLMADR